MQPLPSSVVTKKEKRWWELYEHLIGQKMICGKCFDVQILIMPALEIHPPKFARLGKGKRWYVNGCKQHGKNIWFFLCPKCQGRDGKGIKRMWEDMSTEMQIRVKTHGCSKCTTGTMFEDKNDGELVCLQCGNRRQPTDLD